LTVGISHETGNTSVFVANREVDPAAREADLEPGGILFGYSKLGHFVCEREPCGERCGVEAFFDFGSFLLGAGGAVQCCTGFFTLETAAPTVEITTAAAATPA